MCLSVLRNAQTRVAKTDMVFYKVIREECSHYSPNTFEYYTPFRGVKIVPGVTYVDKGNDFNIKKKDINCGLDAYAFRIDDSGFHLFENQVDAKDYARYANYHRGTLVGTFYHYVVMKAIVPKGTKYIYGTFDGNDSVCAKVVRYELIEEIKLDELCV